MGDNQNPTTTPSGLPWCESNWNHFKCFTELMTRHDRMHGPDPIVLIQPIKEANKTLDNKKFIPLTLSSLDTTYDILADLNDLGYSIHWAINEYGYMGRGFPARRKENVTRIRTFASDIDKPISLPLINKLIEIFSPTCVVLSSEKICWLDAEGIAEQTREESILLRHYAPGASYSENDEPYCVLYKAHFYWQIHNQFGPIAELTDPPRSREEISLCDNWHTFQNALAWKVDDEINALLGIPDDEAAHWTDKGLLPLSQTLRLPGFFHLKDPTAPFITSVYYANTEAVLSVPSMTSWLGGLGLDKIKIQNYELRTEQWKRRNRPAPTAKDIGNAPVSDFANGYLGSGVGGRNQSIHEYAVHLVWKRQLTRAEALAVCLYENTTKNSPPLPDDEVTAIVDSAWTEFKRQRAESKLSRVAGGDSNAAVAATKTFADYFKAQQKDNNVVGAMLGAGENVGEGADTLSQIHVANATEEQKHDPTQRLVYDYSGENSYMEITSDASVVDRVKQRYSPTIVCHPDRSLWVWNKQKELWSPGETHASQMVLVCGTDMSKEPGVLRKFFKKNGEIDEAKYERLKLSLHSEKRIASIMKMLKLDPELAVGENVFDCYPDILNCKNGVINIVTGETSRASVAYMSTRQSGVVLQNNTAASCEQVKFLDAAAIARSNRWCRFVLEIMSGDVDMYHYMQKIAGYSLTLSNPYELMFFFYGVGCNGKSIFTEVLAKMLGTYAYTVPASTFLQGGKDRMSILSQLVGVRMALTSELGHGRSWNEESIKDITGTDSICVRPLYKQSFNYHPQFKVIVRGNYKPKIFGSDYGIWRRIRPVPFDRVFQPHEVDRKLYPTLTTDDGLYDVLCWAVAGHQMLLEEGLTPPQRAAEAYVEYRNQTMPILGFIAECFDLESSGLKLGTLETGIAGASETVSDAEENEHKIGAEGYLPVKYADLVDSGKLHRVYVAWWGRRGNQLSEIELFDACQSLGISKLRVMMVTETQLDPEPKPHNIIGLRIKPEWAAKAKSGRMTYGRPDAITTAAILKTHLQ